jgi:hypothetical protein
MIKLLFVVTLLLETTGRKSNQKRALPPIYGVTPVIAE